MVGSGRWVQDVDVMLRISTIWRYIRVKFPVPTQPQYNGTLLRDSRHRLVSPSIVSHCIPALCARRSVSGADTSGLCFGEMFGLPSCSKMCDDVHHFSFMLTSIVIWYFAGVFRTYIAPVNHIGIPMHIIMWTDSIQNLQTENNARKFIFNNPKATSGSEISLNSPFVCTTLYAPSPSPIQPITLL